MTELKDPPPSMSTNTIHQSTQFVLESVIIVNTKLIFAFNASPSPAGKMRVNISGEFKNSFFGVGGGGA